MSRPCTLLLGVTLLLGILPGSSTASDIRCSFSDSFCQWSHDGWKREGDHVSVDTSTSKQYATLQSNVPNLSGYFCVKFQFRATNPAGASLDVITKQGGTDDILWRVDLPKIIPDQWIDGSVVVEAKPNLQIVFKATRGANAQPGISLKNVEQTDSCEKLRTPDEAFLPTAKQSRPSNDNHRCRFDMTTLAVCCIVCVAMYM